MKQKFTYLLSLMLMCILGASNAMAEDVVVYSMSAPTAPEEVVDVQTTVAVTATFVGGSAEVFNGHASTAKVMVQSGQIKLGGSGKSWFHAKLGSAMEVGDVITIYSTGTTKDETENAYKMSSTSTVSDSFTFPYTVKTGDAFVGKKDIYLSKNASNAFSQITVTRAQSDVAPTVETDLKTSYSAVKGEQVSLEVTISGATTYQWYKCNDANKTGAVAISGATSSSYIVPTTAAGTAYYYCVGTNALGSATSTVAAVAVENAKLVVRSWDFTKGSTWDAGVKAATSLWGNPTKNRYYYLNATSAEELRDNNGVLAGLENIFFTFAAGKLLLGVKSAGDNSSCLQMQGGGKVTIPGCYKGDKIYIRFCCSGENKTVTVTSDQIEEGLSTTSTSRTTDGTVVVKEAGDIVLTMSKDIRLYEIKVNSKYYFVTSFELSTDEVSVEEFNTVSVSGKNFLPTNCSDKTLNWTSSNTAVATVNNGVITGVKAGEAVITATSVDGPSQTVAVTVTPCAPKNASIEMTSNSEAAAPKVESSKTYKLTAKAQGYDFTYQWASKTSEKGAWTNITGATDASYEETAVELGSKFYKVTITNAQGSTTAEYEVKTIAPLAAFTITEKDPETGKVTAINYKALDSDEPQVKVVYQETKAGEQTEVVIPASVEFAGLTYAVTNIGDEAYVNDNTVVSLATTKVLKEIGARAFMFCSNLSEVSLVKGLEKIGDAAFRGCTSLTTFSIPSTVKYVGYKAFADCDNLTDIYYDGTKDEWYALPNIDMAGISKTVTIHFKDGETVNGRGDFVGINNANAEEVQKEGKIFKNGQIMIIKNGKMFNAAGAELK